MPPPQSPRVPFGRSIAVGLLVSVTCLAPGAANAPAAADRTAGEGVALLSAQRAKNGIPSRLTVDQRLSSGCALHLAYLRVNPQEYNGNPHREDPGKTGYTALGASAAAQSDLAPVNYWSADGNPWDMGTLDPYNSFVAPIHENRLMDPATTRAWYAEAPDATGRYRYACMGAAGRRGFAATHFYSFPGSGRSGVAAGVYAGLEAPANPAAYVGLNPGAVTGPNILVWAQGGFGDRAFVKRTTLSSRFGAVGVRTLDARRQGAGILRMGSAIVVPEVVLHPSTRYVLAVTWTAYAERPRVQRVVFTTRPRS